MKSQRKVPLHLLPQKKKRRRNLVAQNKGPRKGERKNHLKENTRSILMIVTVTLILKQTPVMKIPKRKQEGQEKGKEAQPGSFTSGRQHEECQGLTASFQ